MKTSITMTTKGTFTLPADIRKAMGVSQRGDKLALHFDVVRKQAVIFKPKSFRDIQTMTAKYIKAGQKPMQDPSEYYQAEKSRKAISGK